MKALSQLIEDVKNWPISRFSNRRSEFIQEVSQTTQNHFEGLDTEEIDQAIAKAIYLEKQKNEVVLKLNQRQFYFLHLFQSSKVNSPNFPLSEK